jgi:WD40 repeat protein
MAWRLHLSNRTIQQLDLLPGKPSLLAAWSKRDRVTYYDLQTGALIDEVVIEPPEVDDRNSLTWQNFVRELKAPNGAFLPQVSTDHEVIYLAENEHLRLYRGGAGELFLQMQHGSDEVKLDVRSGTIFQQVTLDTTGEIIAALDTKGKLHVYRQTKRLGIYDPGLRLKDDNRASLAISRAGEKLFVADHHQLVQMDTSGKVVQRLVTHYAIGRLACSPDGKWVVTGDAETGVVRVYDSSDLQLKYQRFGIDLLAAATQIQLLADLPPVFIALNALTIDNNGNMALAMSGIICVTSLDRMDNIQLARTPDETPVQA